MWAGRLAKAAPRQAGRGLPIRPDVGGQSPQQNDGREGDQQSGQNREYFLHNRLTKYKAQPRSNSHPLLFVVVDNPLQTVAEMKAVTRKGGYIFALAEPDYSNRIDKPDELVQLGKWQTKSLRKQGADPGFGSRLAETFFQAGIDIRETGTIQGSSNEPSAQEREMEWAVIESDLAGKIPDAEIHKMKRLDEQAWLSGERVLHVPTYFAWGQV